MSKKQKSIKKKTTIKRSSGIKIKVVGVGGAGCAVVDRLMKDRIPQIEFIAVNTDSKSLIQTSAHRKLKIGRKVTKGQGTGMNPVLGRQAVLESQKEIVEILRGADVVFFIAGLGGGTASGGLPTILDLIQQLDILTIILVTKPFVFEGSQRGLIAEQSFNLLTNRADTLISLPNENILKIIDRKTSLIDAFRAVDRILEQTIRGITDIVNFSGLINLDLADLKSILFKAGPALLGIGEAEGDGRAVRAVRTALEGPFFGLSFKGAKGVLFIISGSDNLSIHEVNEAAKYIIGGADSDSRVVFGVATNPSLGERVKVTIIATGFSQNPSPKLDTQLDNIKTQVTVNNKNKINNTVPVKISGNSIYSEVESPAQPIFNKDELEIISQSTDEFDIPAFLRKKKLFKNN